MLTRETAFTGPDYIDLDVTSRCNLTCLGCCFHSPYVKDPKQRYSKGDDIDLGLVRRVMPEIRDLGAQLIVIQGAGEPLIHPEITQIVSEVKKSGLRVIMITNGLLLDREKINALADAGLDMLRMTLWAGSSQEYALQYPGSDPKNLDRFLDILKLLRQMKKERKGVFPHVCLYHPINRNNFKTIEHFVGLALAHGCDSISFSAFSSVWQSLEQFALTKDEEGEVTQVLSGVKKKLNAIRMPHTIDQLITRYRLGEKVWRKIPCYIMWFHARIRSDGAVQACARSELTFGNLHQASFSEIWNGAATRHFRGQAMNLQGLAALTKSCDCDYCCFALDNRKIHRIFKWFVPFRKAPAE